MNVARAVVVTEEFEDGIRDGATMLAVVEVTLEAVWLEVPVDVGPGIEGVVTVKVGVEMEVEVKEAVLEMVCEMVVPPLVIAPPGPPQISPMGQQLYSLFAARLQYFVGGQPPAWLGQQVQVRSMQPTPQSF